MSHQHLAIILIDAANAFDKFQHPFLIKSLMKLGKEVIFLNIIIGQTHCHHTKWGKLRPFPLKSGLRQWCPMLVTLIKYNFGISGQINKTGRRNERIQIRKFAVKLPLFRGDMILYLKHPKILP
jgi:hypothetical protein